MIHIKTLIYQNMVTLGLKIRDMAKKQKKSKKSKIGPGQSYLFLFYSLHAKNQLPIIFLDQFKKNSFKKKKGCAPIQIFYFDLGVKIYKISNLSIHNFSKEKIVD